MVQRRKFSKEFKLEAVNLVVARGVSLAQVSRDLDVGENVLGRWVREFKQSEQQAFPGHGVQKPDDAELTRLRREVAQLKMERDILKKPQPSLPRSRREVRLYSKAPRGLAG
jgi:transposase